MKLKRIFKSPVYTYGILILLGIGTGLISLLLGAAVFGLQMFWSYFSSPLLILLNLLPPVLLILLMYFATGRAWVSFLSASGLLIIMSAINFFKIQVRGDPFIARDIALVTEAGTMLTGYKLVFNWKVWLAFAFLLLGVLFCVFLVRRRQRGLRTRLIGAVSVALVLVLLCFTTYYNDSVYQYAVGSYKLHRWSEAQQFIGRGFLFPFIRSTKDLVDLPPEGYDRDEAAEAMAQHVHTDIPDEQKVNIVSIMLESYADLSQFEEIEFTVDVYEKLRLLEAESVSGVLVDNVFGGGTIDTERLFLTGYTHLGDYRQGTESYVRYLRDQGYYTEGLHAGDAWFYDRQSVNKNLGFHRYFFLEDFEGSTRWDTFFFPTVMQLYEERDPDVPYFSYNLSYQNHGAYENTCIMGGEYVAQGDMSDESYCILNNYLDGIYDTTERIADFVDFFAARPEPVVLVIFGDHMPWLGNFDSVYHDLGINIDIATPQGLYNYYSTPFFIWANDAAKAVTGSDFKGSGGTISPCFLMNKVFALCGFGGDSYMQAANALLEHIEVIHTPTGLFQEKGVLTNVLSPEAEAAYKKFLILEYYRRKF